MPNVATAIAHPNIALIKYWGKRDLSRNLPAVPSVSLTIDRFETRTRVAWGAERDELHINGRAAPFSRVGAFLDKLDRGRPPCAIETTNNFPTAAGLASSASAFAALAVAANAAAEARLDRAALSSWARTGSGSACRSLFGGFVHWNLGELPDGSDSHGRPIDASWDLRLLVAVVDTATKPVSSTDGMLRSQRTSPYWDAWVAQSPHWVEHALAAIAQQDLCTLGSLMERSTYAMHATMHSSNPPLNYWKPATLRVLSEVERLRQSGVQAWCTMDAGPQVKVLCAPCDVDVVHRAIAPHALEVSQHRPAEGARLVDAD